MRKRIIICMLLLAAPSGWGERIENSLGMALRLVEGGRFIQGSDGGENKLSRAFPHHINAQYFGNAESPAHPTWITRPYYIGQHEVTRAEFQKFVTATKYQTDAERGAIQMLGWEPQEAENNWSKAPEFKRDAKFNWQNPGFRQSGNHPVVGLTIHDVQAFIAWLSKKEGKTYRLPSEAEWEYACRAGTDTWFSFGDTPEKTIHQYANVANVELENARPGSVEHQWLLDWDNNPADGYVFTAPVGCLEANDWGFNDMHGNVWEWCADLWLDTAYNPWKKPDRFKPAGTAVDPINRDDPQTEANDFRVIRGGSWYTGPIIARSANRTYFDAPDAACYIGFRVVMEADPNAYPDARKAYEAEVKARKAVELIGGVFYANRGLDVELRFENEKFTERGLAALRFIPGVEILKIQARGKKGPVITQAGIKLIGELTALKTISFEAELDTADLDLSPLARLPNLEVLSFPRSSPLNDAHLSGLAASSSLKAFYCFGTAGGMTDQGLLNLKNNRSLEVLHAQEAEATGTYLAAFKGMPLRDFETSPPHNKPAQLTNAGIENLRAFPALTQLRITRETQIGATLMDIVADCKNLRTLNIEGCSEIPAASFSVLSNLQHLRSLDLRNTQADDIAIDAIAQLPRLNELRCSTLSAAGAKRLAEVFTLERVTIGEVLGGDESLRPFGRINRLDNLDIGGPGITGKGLGPITRLPRLRDLRLRCPDLTDVAFDHLRTARTLHKLRLVERGVKPAAALTNDGIMKMAKATWLRELWLPRNDTGITEDAIKELNEMMPKTGVIPYTVSWQ